ncbi:hypothetical protein HDU96_006447 [Phlyctochytrium bullatum]|nr:hypothetical protein HDU96_006447 [Phlyctochytrium bullatum]
MSRHSKNNTALGFFTYAERQKLSYGTQKQRLGHLACKECFYENLLAQKKEVARQQKVAEMQRRAIEDELKRREQAIKEAEIRDFERTQTQFLATMANDAKPLTKVIDGIVFKGLKTPDGIIYIPDNTVDYDTSELYGKVKELEKESPSLTPEATPTLVEDPPKTLLCTASDPPHAIHSLKKLTAVNFVKSPTKDNAKGPSNMCPSCVKNLHNGLKMIVIKTCGHVICRNCYTQFVKNSKKCLVCEASFKDADNITLAVEGTGFVMSGGKVEVAKAAYRIFWGSERSKGYSHEALKKSPVAAASVANEQSPPAPPTHPNNIWFLNPNTPIKQRTISIPHPTEKRPLEGRYSRFRCSGDDNDINGYVERLCLFENLCYDQETSQFYFYRRPDRPPPYVLFEARAGEMAEFHADDHGFVPIKQLFWAAVGSEWDTFAPKMIASEAPTIGSPETTVRLEKLHILWSTWAADDNLGHLLWEELASLWYGMLRMNVFTENVTAMHWPDDLPNRKLALKFRNGFFPAISGTPPVSFGPYMAAMAGGKSKRYVCFDQLLAGGNVRRFLQRYGWHNYGHEPLFFSLRGRILQSHGLDPFAVPRKHQILITHKTSSNYHSDDKYTSHRSIYNIDKVRAFLAKRYPGVEVKVLDFKDLTITEQLREMMATTLIVTPPGGISMVLPFLPDGAHAIILDYLEKEDNDLVGTKAGESVSMEAPFWNYWPHFKKLYYQVRSKTEMVSDDPSRSVDEVSWRDEVSIVVDLKRLGRLADQAFDAMAV